VNKFESNVLEFKKLTSRKTEYCICEHKTKSSVRKSATYGIYIMKVPAGNLCASCAKEWKELWMEHSTNFEQKNGREFPPDQVKQNIN
jgi:bacterioferritin-associated ferredoxin